MTQSSDAICKAVAAHAKQLEKLATDVHGNPELGFEETKARDWQVKLLRRWEFKVRTPFAGLATAFNATRGKGSPVFCFMSEYDALPDIGHACGHNLICAAALGAGTALADVMQKERTAGTVVVMGTPGEESFGGKVKMIRKGALKGIDAAIMAHPSNNTGPDPGSNAIQRFDVAFAGKAAHAAGSAEKGRNALDAVMLVFHAVNAWRQQLPESARIHGIVTEGGVKPNIIPHKASCMFYLRAPDEARLSRMAGRFADIAKGAALMTGTSVSLAPAFLPYKARKPNQPLNQAYIKAARAAGMKPASSAGPNRGSSDFGDVSHVLPSAHVYFKITKRDVAAHSIAFEKAAGSAYARRQMLRAAEALARVGYRYFTDGEFRDLVTFS